MEPVSPALGATVEEKTKLFPWKWPDVGILVSNSQARIVQPVKSKAHGRFVVSASSVLGRRGAALNNRFRVVPQRACRVCVYER